MTTKGVIVLDYTTRTPIAYSRDLFKSPTQQCPHDLSTFLPLQSPVTLLLQCTCRLVAKIACSSQVALECECLHVYFWALSNEFRELLRLGVRHGEVPSWSRVVSRVFSQSRVVSCGTAWPRGLAVVSRSCAISRSRPAVSLGLVVFQ